MYPARVLIRVADFLRACEGREGCWSWPGPFAGSGAGLVLYAHRGQHRTALAHVAAYQLRNGDPADGLCVVQACGSAACVNPGHLVLQPDEEAASEPPRPAHPDGGSTPAPSAKLNETAVSAILASIEPASVLAARHGVCVNTIGDIRAGRTWRHVPRA